MTSKGSESLFDFTLSVGKGFVGLFVVVFLGVGVILAIAKFCKNANCTGRFMNGSWRSIKEYCLSCRAIELKY